MTNARALTLTTPGEREIAMTRVFAAPRRLVFEAFTRPELLQRWLLGPPGWSMPVCEIDLRVGGSYRYLWRGADGTEMGVRGVYREIAPPERIVATEVFDQAWYPGEAQTTFELVERQGETTLTLTVLYASREARDVALRSDMEKGVAASYDRLEELLASAAREDTSSSDGPRIVEMTARPIAVLRFTIPRREIQSVMGTGRRELKEALAAQGVTPAGPWFSHHLRMAPDIFDFEIGWPVAAPIAAAGRVLPAQWTAGIAAQTVYHGAYEGLGAAWGELNHWIAAEGHASAPDLWESYAVGPESSADPAAWRTELTRPLIRQAQAPG
jgi:uncharacterized protein YndB with AHSA1/START domain/effector-binding domain-containing protein